MKGVPWSITSAPYPQFIMGPLPKFMGTFDVAEFVKEQITQTGFHGVHLPLIGGWDDKVLEFLKLADQENFLIHFWLYGDRDSGTAPKNPNSTSAREWQVGIADKLRPYRNWSMGLGYDLQEWAPRTDDVGGFVHFWRINLQLDRRFGGRFLPRDRGPYPGQFISVEQQIITKASMQSRLRTVLDSKRPMMSSDRFRVRSGFKPKDWSLGQIPGGITDCLEVGFSAIWGYGDQVSDLGSQPWPNKIEMRTALGAGVILPPIGNECKSAAAYAVDLRVLQEKMQVTLTDVDAIIAKMETCTA